MKELVVGGRYTTKEMQEFFGINENKWKRERDRYLKNLGEAYIYSVEYDKNDGRKKIYVIEDKIGEYNEPPKRKKNSKVEELDDIIRNQIKDIVKEQPINSFSNLNNIIRERESKISEHYTCGSSKERVRVIGREMFGKYNYDAGSYGSIVSKKWAVKNDDLSYTPLNEKELNELYKDINNSRNFLVDEFGMDENIARAESFKHGRTEFKEKYGKVITCVSVFEKDSGVLFGGNDNE